MNGVIFLACIGACVGQSPANTYLPLVGTPYLSGDPELHVAHSFGAARSEDLDVLRRPSNSIQTNSNRTIEDINAAAGASEVNENVQLSAQAAYQQSVLPQSRFLGATHSGIPTALYTTHISDPGSVPFDNVPYSRNGGNLLLRANPRSDSLPQLNPQYAGPSLFSHSAQAAAERRSPSHHQQYQPTAHPSNINLRPTAAPYSRSLEGYYSSDEPQASHQSNQNGDVYQVTQGSLEPSNYQFSYDVNAVERGRSVQFGHEERRAVDEAAGSYSVLLPDGQRQIVEYTADRDGYRPRVTYDGNGNAGTDVYGNAGTDVYGNDEPSVIAARSNLNGQANAIQSRYLPQDTRTRSQAHLYN